VRTAGEKPLIEVFAGGEGDPYERSIRLPMRVQTPRDDLTTLRGQWRTGTPDDRERLFAAADHIRCTSDMTTPCNPPHSFMKPYLRPIGTKTCAGKTAPTSSELRRVMRQTLVDRARNAAPKTSSRHRAARWSISSSMTALPALTAAVVSNRLLSVGAVRFR
jgi:hypothetical protein